MENQAIDDIILEMTKFEEMKKLNGLKNEKLILYVASELDTFTTSAIKPDGYETGANGKDYSKVKIESNKKQFEENLAQYEKEEELFSDLKNGKVLKRKLNYIFTNKNLNIKLIEIDKIKKFDTQENELGYLSISRIIFNENYSKGYLHFNFICGIGCAWNNNIEIIKVNGKWEISEYFSGGIS